MKLILFVTKGSEVVVFFCPDTIFITPMWFDLDRPP